MQTSKQTLNERKMKLPEVERDANCCGTCANRENILNAHCGKSLTIEQILGEGGDPDIRIDPD